MFPLHSEFQIFNRLRVPVKVISGGETIGTIEDQSSISLSRAKLPVGRVNLKFVSGEEKISEKLFSSRLEIPEIVDVAVAKAYFDGTITPSVNTVQGLSWVHIHNHLQTPLTFTLLNGVPLFRMGPGEKIRFLGEKGMGVPFGTNLFNRFLGKLSITRRISDIVIE